MSLKRIKANLTVKSPAAPTREARKDSWRNLITKLGVDGADKRNASTPVLTLIRQEDADMIWRSGALAARIVETIPDEMTREGWKLAIDGESEDDDSEVSKKVTNLADDLNFNESLNEGLRYQRSYGGGAILLGADDGQKDLGRPLVPERVRSFDYLTTFTPRECVPVVWYEDPRAPKFGQPKLYQINPDLAASSGMIVHESRILAFPGARTSRRSARFSPNLWGDSIFVRVYNEIRDFEGSFDGASSLIQDFAQAVLKIKGLAELVASEDPDDANRFRARVAAVDYSRSSIRTMLLDADEDFERKATPMTGLPEVLDKLTLRLAAVADMPVCLLMGQAPAGLNATGDSDIRFFYDRVKARQRNLARPRINTFVRLAMKALGLTEPEGWSVAFNPLWQLDGVQESTMRKTNADADNIYFQMGALSPHEIRKSRFGADEYGTEIQLDADTQSALDAPDLTDEGEPKPVQTPRISTTGPTPPELDDKGLPVPKKDAPRGTGKVE